MTATIYLDASGDVLGVAREMEGHTPVSLAAFQEVEPTATERVPGAPMHLTHKGRAVFEGWSHRRTSGDGTQLAHYSKIRALDPLKAKRFDEIDARTTELVAAGFTFDGQTFGLGTAQRVCWIELETNHAAGRLAWPVTVGTLDHRSYALTEVSLPAFLAAALAGHMTPTAEGVALKQQIVDAVDVAAVDAVVDTR